MMLTGLDILIVQHFVGVHLIQERAQNWRDRRTINWYSSNGATKLSWNVLLFLSSQLSSPSVPLIAL